MFNFKVNSDRDKDDVSSSRSSNTRPDGIPKTERDFRKVLSEKDRRRNKDDEDNISTNKEFVGLEEGLGYEEIAFSEEAPKQQPSLFDLSRKGMNKKEEASQAAQVASMASADELPTNSPNTIFNNLALKEKAQAKANKKLEGSAGKMGSVDADDEENPKVASRFSSEGMDLSSVNPHSSNQQAIQELNNDPRLDKPLASQKMTTLQLVEAIVKALSTVETQGKTDTVVTLQRPPMFAGANVILTSYETAKGEFNIRFENMSQQGKSFMDMQQNQDSLRFALQEKGYAVHIVVVTTNIETPKFVADAQKPREGNPDDQPKDKEQSRKRKQEDQA